MKHTLDIDIAAGPDAVWHILAERYCEIADWTDAVQRSWPMTAADVPDGVTVAADAPVPGRWVVTPAGELSEVLTAYDPATRSFTFAGFGMPAIVTCAINRTTVCGTGDRRCRVTLDVEMRLWGPLRIFEPILKLRAGKAFGSLLTDLRRHAENAGADREAA